MEGCRKFSSFDQLKTWISNKEKTDNIKLRIGDSRTIACVRKRGIIRFINEQLKYYEITYRCIHSGHRISKSSGQRPGQSTFRIGCPFFMRLSASSDGQHLVVQKFLDQHNHEHTKPLKTKMIVQSYDGELKATSCSELLSEVVCNGMLEIASEDAIEGAGDNGHNTLVLTDNLIQKCSRVTPEIRRLKRKRKYDKFVKDDPASTNSQEVAGTEHEPDLTQHCSPQKPDEYDLFAQHIAEQLRKLPTQRFIVLQDKIQRLVTSERIEHLSEVSEKCSSNVSSASPPQDERTEEIHHVWFNGHLYTKQKSRID